MKKHTTLPAALLFLILAAAYWRFDVLGTATGKIRPFRSENLYVLYYPLIHYGIGSMRALHIPLWNPYQSLGVPFLGSALFGLFSPFSFLYYILPTHLAMGYSTILNIALAGLFTFLFLRKSLGIEPSGAFTGALVFMFSGSVLLELIHPSLLGAMAFLPLVLLLTHKVFDTGEGRWAVLFALALACQMLTGAVQIVVHTLFMTGVYSLYLLWINRKAGKALTGPVFLLFIGGVAAVAISSPQWLPLMELSRLTGRNSAGLSLTEAEPFRAFFTPWIISKSVLFGMRGLTIGFIPIILSLTALFNRKTRPYAVFFTFTAILTLLLAFGTDTPLYGIYYHYIPTGKMFRVPMRWLWLTAFSIAILTAIGSERIFNSLEGKRGLRSVAIIIIPLLITAFLFRHNIMELYNHPQNTPGIFTRHDEDGAFLRRVQGTYRTYIASDFANDFSLPQKFGTLEKVFVLNDYESLSLKSYKRFVAGITGRKILLRQKIFYGSYNLKGNAPDMRLMNLLSVGFIMENGVKVFGKKPPHGIKKIYENKGLVIYKNSSALPRAYVVYKSETIRNRKRALERLASPSFNPRAAVILNKNPGLPQRRGVETTTAVITRFSPERIEIDADLSQRGVLVLTDFFYPGWQAYVDGAQSPILRANTIMRGLELKKGAHKVVFVYRPRPFRIGLWTSMFTLAALIIYLGADTLKRMTKKRI